MDILRLTVLSKRRPKSRRAVLQWITEIKLITNYEPGISFEDFQCPSGLRYALWGGVEHYRNIMENTAPTPAERIVELIKKNGPITLKDARRAVPEYAINSLPVLLSTMARVGEIERCGRGVYGLPKEDV